MTKMKCGCKIMDEMDRFERIFKDDKGCFIEIKSMRFYYKHFVNVCGECEKKANEFNELEKKKLEIEKKQFKILCDEVESEDEGMSFDEMVEQGILLPDGLS